MEQKNVVWVMVALILGISSVVSTVVLAGGIKDFKKPEHLLEVKGSAKEQIKSDYAVWTGAYSTSQLDLKTAYQDLQSASTQVKQYLLQKGFQEKDLVFSSVTTTPIYSILPNGSASNFIESYRLSQTVQITSKNVDQIAEISRNSTELINRGVSFESMAPQYFYTKLADQKIKMLELATKDAKARADAMLAVTGKTTGSLVSATVGIFQITPLYSNEVSDYGINDTESIDKEITAVVNCSFEVQ